MATTLVSRGLRVIHRPLPIHHSVSGIGHRQTSVRCSSTTTILTRQGPSHGYGISASLVSFSSTATATPSPSSQPSNANSTAVSDGSLHLGADVELASTTPKGDDDGGDDKQSLRGVIINKSADVDGSMLFKVQWSNYDASWYKPKQLRQIPSGSTTSIDDDTPRGGVVGRMNDSQLEQFMRHVIIRSCQLPSVIAHLSDRANAATMAAIELRRETLSADIDYRQYRPAISLIKVLSELSSGPSDGGIYVKLLQIIINELSTNGIFSRHDKESNQLFINMLEMIPTVNGIDVVWFESLLDHNRNMIITKSKQTLNDTMTASASTPVPSTPASSPSKPAPSASTSSSSTTPMTLLSFVIRSLSRIPGGGRYVGHWFGIARDSHILLPSIIHLDILLSYIRNRMSLSYANHVQLLLLGRPSSSSSSVASGTSTTTAEDQQSMMYQRCSKEIINVNVNGEWLRTLLRECGHIGDERTASTLFTTLRSIANIIPSVDDWASLIESSARSHNRNTQSFHHSIKHYNAMRAIRLQPNIHVYEALLLAARHSRDPPSSILPSSSPTKGATASSSTASTATINSPSTTTSSSSIDSITSSLSSSSIATGKLN
jgi:hypothetical protein